MGGLWCLGRPLGFTPQSPNKYVALVSLAGYHRWMLVSVGLCGVRWRPARPMTSLGTSGLIGQTVWGTSTTTTSEYNMPLCLAFVDCEKAFDSVEGTAISNALYEQGMDETYIKLMENIYANGTSVVRLHKDADKVKIGRGVGQGDTYSPKLFTACLEGIFRKLSLESK